MNWKTIRLELGPTPRYPNGSASRAFVLRAPLDNAGEIDAEAVARNPKQATARRFWASERDQAGRLEPVGGTWVFRTHAEDGGSTYCIGEGPFAPNARIIIRQPDGTELRFRVVSIKGLDSASSAEPWPTASRLLSLQSWDRREETP